jgi:hypothetical protein
VKETWAVDKQYDKLPGSKVPIVGRSRVWYFTDGPKPEWAGRTRSARFMPRWASRITLELTGVRVERVQGISVNDARSEGCTGRPALGQMSSRNDGYAAVREYQQLWDEINAKRGYPWALNPWVWVLEFRVVGNGE